MPRQPDPPTLAAVVHKAVDATDPDDPILAELVERFEDADEPVTAIEDLDTHLHEQANAIGDLEAMPQLAMAVAVAQYLGRRRDEMDADREELLRLAARAEFDGDPPAPVAEWLEDAGVVV